MALDLRKTLVKLYRRDFDACIIIAEVMEAMKDRGHYN